jgi:FXSXX-COOH protein
MKSDIENITPGATGIIDVTGVPLPDLLGSLDDSPVLRYSVDRAVGAAGKLREAVSAFNSAI